MTPFELAEAAAMLREAAAKHEFITPLRETYLHLDAASAYAVQRLNTEARIAEGRRVVGCKIGLTSMAVQKQLGVDQPDFGMLFDDMGYGDGEEIPFNVLHQPKVEAEVAFVLGHDLSMEKPGLADVISVIDYALPAMEIVGSRIANWNIRIVDTIRPISG
jgi:2-keto-4-pentenoate hydratase